ncbi:citrate synthase [Chitinolyticbacter meiyuanensis]|uniref:citrate synthase n=1 Tax=Chitinolyticbacter meiyuanensis TaxID=682798 RepID=UPI001C9E990A|nr:citrate synthase [Chitinolyticbacter meiyuanensis]
MYRIGDDRRSSYLREDIERLLRLKAPGRKPERIAAASLTWGQPVLDTQLSGIAKGDLFYRRQSASTLADTAHLEAVAALLWDCDAAVFDAPAPEATAPWMQLCRSLQTASFADRAIALTALGRSALIETDPAATAVALLRLVVAGLLGTAPRRQPIHQQFASVWSLAAPAAKQVRAALVLSADHELNVSTFTARCIASAGADLGACVLGGLSAVSGTAHGGQSAEVDAWLDRMATGATLDAHNFAPGFRHALYPAGDPRAAKLLSLLTPSPAAAQLLARAVSLSWPPPNIDLALVLLCRQLGLPRGSAFALFAAGRTIGWLAHALEQRRDGRLIRPRARYLR